MLKIRIIPVLLYKNIGLVKGVQFDSWRRIGSPMQAVKVYNMREVDELIFLDITATRQDRKPDFAIVDDIADECFMPLTVGGGIKTIADMEQMLRVGADKITVNTFAVESPELIYWGAKRFGSQCIVVSLDVKRHTDGQYEIFTRSGTKATGKNPIEFVKEVESLGAGEILLTSIDRDGTMRGYDIDLVRQVSETISIPIIASGGAGNYKHMLSVIREGKASAIAASSIFHFTEQTPNEAKKFLLREGVNVRL